MSSHFFKFHVSLNLGHFQKEVLMRLAQEIGVANTAFVVKFNDEFDAFCDRVAGELAVRVNQMLASEEKPTMLSQLGCRKRGETSIFDLYTFNLADGAHLTFSKEIFNHYLEALKHELKMFWSANYSLTNEFRAGLIRFQGDLLGMNLTPCTNSFSTEHISSGDWGELEGGDQFMLNLFGAEKAMKNIASIGLYLAVETKARYGSTYRRLDGALCNLRDALAESSTTVSDSLAKTLVGLKLADDLDVQSEQLGDHFLDLFRKKTITQAAFSRWLRKLRQERPDILSQDTPIAEVDQSMVLSAKVAITSFFVEGCTRKSFWF